MDTASDEYRETAEKLGVKMRIGKHGFKLFPRYPNGGIRGIIQHIPLDGWIFDKQEIVQALFDDPHLEVKMVNKGGE